MKNVFTFMEVFIVLTIIGIFAAEIAGPFYFCPKKWERSGMKAEFFFGSGCLVQRKDGTWVPEKVLRDVSL